MTDGIYAPANAAEREAIRRFLARTEERAPFGALHAWLRLQLEREALADSIIQQRLRNEISPVDAARELVALGWNPHKAWEAR